MRAVYLIFLAPLVRFDVIIESHRGNFEHGYRTHVYNREGHIENVI